MIQELFNEFDRRGLRAEIVGGALRLTPSSRIDSELREALRENMPDVLAHIASNGDRDVEWRLRAFLTQLQSIHLPAVLPFLVALNAASKQREACPSCAELREDGDGFLCALCVTAKRLALDLWFARLVKAEKVA
jgi:hypothetical protein